MIGYKVHGRITFCKNTARDLKLSFMEYFKLELNAMLYRSYGNERDRMCAGWYAMKEDDVHCTYLWDCGNQKHSKKYLQSLHDDGYWVAGFPFIKNINK